MREIFRTRSETIQIKFCVLNVALLYLFSYSIWIFGILLTISDNENYI